MRIALLTHQWPGARMGGIGTYTSLCAHALARAGHEAHVFTFPLPEELKTHLLLTAPPGLHLHEVPGFAQRVLEKKLPAAMAAAVHAGGEASYRLGHACLLCAAVREFHAKTPLDVLEAPEYEALALPLLLDRITALAVVTQLHSGSAINRLGNRQHATDEDRAVDALEAAAILGADAVCAPTNRVAEITQEALGIKCAPTVLPLPIPLLPNYEFQPPPPDGPVLFVGRLEKLKGADILARALPAFLQARPNALVRILGPDTPTAELLEGKRGSMRQWMTGILPPELQARVEFLGERSRTDIHSELLASSFVVIPSLYESFSLVCAEAMAAGRTAVVARDIGTAEVIADAGIFFEPGNPDDLARQMIALHQDRPRLDTLSLAALNRAREYLDEAVAIPRRIRFYENAIKNAKETQAPWLQRLAQKTALPPPLAASLLGTLASVTAFLSGAPLALTPTPGSRLLQVLGKLTETPGRPIAFWLYGAGRHTARLLAEKHLWESHGHHCVGLIDDHPRFAAAGATAWGLPVLTPAAIEQRLLHPQAKEKTEPIVLSTDTFTDQFWAQTARLRELGMRVYRLYA